MKLERPLVIFDLETTGTNTDEDRIIQIAIDKLHPDGETFTWSTVVNPQQQVSENILILTGLTQDEIDDAQPFRYHVDYIDRLLEGCDLGGYNIIKFDIPILQAEFQRIGKTFSLHDRAVVDSYQLWQQKETRTLKDAAKRFLHGAKISDEDFHDARFDTIYTRMVLEGQLKEFGLEDMTMQELSDELRGPYLDFARKFKMEDGLAIVTFGKHSGTAICDLPPGYVSWMRDNFGPESKKIIDEHRRRPSHPQNAPDPKIGIQTELL